MIVQRFRGQIRPETTVEAVAAFAKVVAPSRAVEGVISYDICQDITNPNTILAIEVFEDQAAVDRQESLPEILTLERVLPDMLAQTPESSKFYVSGEGSPVYRRSSRPSYRGRQPQKESDRT
jgi:quinol monooxygenase YgiN